MSKWIKVEDRLPSNARAVLVWVMKQYSDGELVGTYCVASCNVDDVWIDWITEKDLEDELDYTVIAWQELPDEYRGE